MKIQSKHPRTNGNQVADGQWPPRINVGTGPSQFSSPSCCRSSVLEGGRQRFKAAPDTQREKMFVGKLRLPFVMLEVYPLSLEGIKSMHFGHGLIPSFRGTFFWLWISGIYIMYIYICVYIIHTYNLVKLYKSSAGNPQPNIKSCCILYSHYSTAVGKSGWKTPPNCTVLPSNRCTI